MSRALSVDTKGSNGRAHTNRLHTVVSSRVGKWTDAIIIEQLRKLHRQSKPMWSRRLRTSHSALFAAAIKCFGSYRNAVTAAGVDYRSVQQMIPGRWNRKNVCRELRRLHREKTPIHYAAAEAKHPALVLAAHRYFGSYGKAVEAAGLSYLKIRIRPMPSWDKKRVLVRLRELDHANAGLWKRALRRSDPYLERAARRNFGSYERAAKLVRISSDRLQPPPFRIWSPDRIIADLRALYKKDPVLLKPIHLLEQNPRLLRACRRQLGSYRQALERAGISYWQVVGPSGYSSAEVKNQLIALFENGRDIRYSMLRRADSKLFSSARRCFGSYQAAVAAAGLDYPPAAPLRHWTAALVLRHLAELHRRDKDLRWRPFQKTNLPLYHAAKHYFGMYQIALKKAGIDYKKMASQQLHRQLPARSKRGAR